MNRDLAFFGGVILATLAVLGWLLSAPPFAEPRSHLGALWGWGLPLVTIVPSYVLLARTLHDEKIHRFHRAFMLGTMARFLVVLVGTVVFHFTAAEGDSPAPFKTFLLALFLGWLLLTALELPLALRRRAPGAPRTAPHAASLEDHA